EAKAVAAVTHPGLAQIYGIESWEGNPVLIFEYLGGGTLADRLSHGRLPIHEAFAMGMALTQALIHVHRAGILHRDIKPSNIGFTEGGECKLLDFGVAKLLSGTDTVNEAGIPASFGLEETSGSATTRKSDPSASQKVPYRVGTPAYMSPEAIRGN